MAIALLIVAGLVTVLLGLKTLKARSRREARETSKKQAVAKTKAESKKSKKTRTHGDEGIDHSALSPLTQPKEKTKVKSKESEKTGTRDDEGTDSNALSPLTQQSCRFFKTEQEADEYINILLDNEVMNDLRFFETEQEADEYIAKLDLENFYPKHCGGVGAPYLWIITDGFGRYVRYVTLSSTRPCSGRHPLMDYDEWDSIGR